MNDKNIPWKRILTIGAATAGLLTFLFGLFIWYLIASAPDIDTITVSPAESATYICDQEGNYLRKLTLASSNRDIVALKEIPKTLQQAMIAIEDSRFYEHGGIDIRGILRAFWKGITRGSFSEGASTITQQLIKNNVFTEWTQENSFYDRFRRKIQEQSLAIQLEDRMSKDEILENYLNTINMGAGCYGVQCAAQRYFGKNVSELTLSEAAVLAAIPQNPSGNNPILYPKANQKRQQTILTYMQDQDYISQEELSAALADDVYSRIRTYDESYEENSVYSYYEDALIDQAIAALMEEKGYSSDQAYRAVYSGGLRIYSAQDQHIQQICDEEFLNPANFPEGTEFGIDYALSVADENSHVTHYGSDALKEYVCENLNPDFDLLCTSEEEALTYTDAFRKYILGGSEDVSEAETAKSTTDTGEDFYPLTVLGERLSLSPQPQASVTIIDQKTGCVRAVVGGRGEKTASLTLNRATRTTRQPGSTFKILTAYAPALDSDGQTLATLYENEPYQYTNGTPVSNWDITDYSGEATIREAITRSINVIAVKCITKITPQLGFDYARRFGISTLHESYETAEGTSSDVIQPLALGGITQGVTNLELCNAYAVIANGGIYNTPKFFTKIVDRQGEVLFDYTASTSDTFAQTGNTNGSASAQVLQASTAFLLTDAMTDVVSSPSGTAYGTIRAAGQPVAGKTGTTSNYKDIWFAGYTPYYTCCVWGGYDNNRDLPSGSTYHSYNKILWSAIMNRIHADLPAAAFEQPDSVNQITLCKTTHLPAVPGVCPETYTEYFAAGTQLEEECPLHEPVTETEPISIYPEILDQLVPETESETDSELSSETDSEHTSDLESEQESTSESEDASVLESEQESASESEDASVLESEQESASSFDDFLNRLNEQRWTPEFSLP